MITDKLVIGVDIGGTKIATGILDRYGNIIDKEVLFTKPEEGQIAVINRILSSIEFLIGKHNLSREEILAIGVGVPGSVDLRTGIVVLAPNIFWVNVPLRDVLEEHFRCKVYLDYDTKASALAEYIKGAGRGMANFAYVTISTGIGCGLVLNGKVFRGSLNTAGEIGHLVVVPNGPLCTCGNQGCLQMISSGPAIVRQVKEAIKKGHHSIIMNYVDNVEEIRAEHVIQALKDLDPLALSIFDNSMLYLSLGISHMVNLLNLDLVILGGGIVEGADGLVLEYVKEKIIKYIYPPSRSCFSITNSQIGKDVGLIGAGLLPFYFESE